MNRRVIAISILSFLIISSCVTINIYFPAAAVEKAAEKIVKEVWGEEGARPEIPKKEGEPNKNSGPESHIYQSIKYLLAAIGPSEAYAQEPDINISTPPIRALKKSIKDRAASIKPYMDRGNVGISNEGLLVIRSLDGLNLKEKARLKRLINAENRDRNALYREIARANNFPPERVSDIKKIFAKSWISQAKKGWWVQFPDGKWSRKQ
jgi:uncharacterized protein YdbL (DUF1318 family)